MWRPPQRIRHSPSPGRIPTQSEAAAARLFSPVRLGALTLEQRTWVPAMVPWRATEEGFVTEEVIDWYERFARGRPGAIVVEATGIRDVPSGPLLRIGHDRFLPGLKRLVRHRAAMPAAGTRSCFIQIIDFLSVRRSARTADVLCALSATHRDAPCRVCRAQRCRSAREARVATPNDRTAATS